MKKRIISLVMLSAIVLPLIVCSCSSNGVASSESQNNESVTSSSSVSSTSQDNSSSLRASKKNGNQAQIITAKVIRVGRYLQEGYDYDSSVSGTVVIFENGHVFKRLDKSGAFACALKEGDVVTYERSSDGVITFKKFGK